MYACVQTVTIIRSKHRVTFNQHTTVERLIKDLQQLPPNATFEEMKWCHEQDGHKEISYLEFHHELTTGAKSQTLSSTS